MSIIKKYKLFIEARFGDILNIKSQSNNDIENRFKELKGLEYNFSKKLLNYLTLGKRINGKKIRLKISWNDSILHKIQSRIKERTSFKDAEEFNSLLSETFNKIFPDMIGKDINSSGRYSIFIKEHNISIIIGFDINQFINGEYIITIITLLPGRKGGEKVVKIIDI